MTNEGVQVISNNSYFIEGTIGYQGDYDWKNVI